MKLSGGSPALGVADRQRMWRTTWPARHRASWPFTPRQPLHRQTSNAPRLRSLRMPYQFKLRFLYGFNPPIHEALGYGKGLHDALAEAHERALSGDIMSLDQASNLFDRHPHTPYA